MRQMTRPLSARAPTAERLRVLHVLPWILSGGVERRRLLLARHLPYRFEQRIACLTARGSIAEEIEQAGVAIHTIGAPGLGITSFAAHRRLHALVRNWRPHIVHGAIFEGMVLAGLTGLTNRVPVVLLEETSMPDATAPKSRQRSRVSRALVRSLAKRTSGIVAVSPRIGEHLVETHEIPRHKVHVVPNGVGEFTLVDLGRARAERSRLRISESAFVFGTVCRINNEHKRISDFLEAFAFVRKHHHAHALIVGEGSDRAMLESHADELGLRDAVTFTGRREDRHVFFAAMDAFVLSSATEAAPLSLMEAMLAARPCVATTVGGVVDIIEDERTGLLVAPYRPSELAAAMKRLIDEPITRTNLASNASRRATSEFTGSRYARDVCSLYDRLTSRSPH